MQTNGKLKGPVRGNQCCWFGNLEYVVKDLPNLDQKLLQNYNLRKRKYSPTQNISALLAKKAVHRWCELCGVPSDRVNNMWARKSFVNMGLRELNLPDQQVMDVTGHKNAQQMRKDYRETTHDMRNKQRQNRPDAAEQPLRCSGTSTASCLDSLQPLLKFTASLLIRETLSDLSKSLQQTVASTNDKVEKLSGESRHRALCVWLKSNS